MTTTKLLILYGFSEFATQFCQVGQIQQHNTTKTRGAIVPLGGGDVSTVVLLHFASCAKRSYRAILQLSTYNNRLKMIPIAPTEMFIYLADYKYCICSIGLGYDIGALLEILQSVQKYIQNYLILYYNIQVCKIIHSRYQSHQFVT